MSETPIGHLVDAIDKLTTENAELLAMLQEIVNDHHDLGHVSSDTWDRAEALIAKAKGGAE